MELLRRVNDLDAIHFEERSELEEKHMMERRQLEERHEVEKRDLLAEVATAFAFELASAEANSENLLEPPLFSIPMSPGDPGMGTINASELSRQQFDGAASRYEESVEDFLKDESELLYEPEPEPEPEPENFRPSKTSTKLKESNIETDPDMEALTVEVPRRAPSRDKEREKRRTSGIPRSVAGAGGGLPRPVSASGGSLKRSSSQDDVVILDDDKVPTPRANRRRSLAGPSDPQAAQERPPVPRGPPAPPPGAPVQEEIGGASADLSYNVDKRTQRKMDARDFQNAIDKWKLEKKVKP